MFHYYLVYKPFNTLSQFTREGPDDLTLSDLGFNFPEDVYPVGRLDKDSEGLLLLTNDNSLKTSYLNPDSKTPKTYWVQVEGDITDAAVAQLAKGVALSDKGKKWKTLPAQVRRFAGDPELPPRNPPIRFRKEIPTSWLELTIVEGKNRQVRRMTAAVGFPTLRLVRAAIGPLKLGDLTPGQVKMIPQPALAEKEGAPAAQKRRAATDAAKGAKAPAAKKWGAPAASKNGPPATRKGGATAAKKAGAPGGKSGAPAGKKGSPSAGKKGGAPAARKGAPAAPPRKGPAKGNLKRPRH